MSGRGWPGHTPLAGRQGLAAIGAGLVAVGAKGPGDGDLVALGTPGEVPQAQPERLELLRRGQGGFDGKHLPAMLSEIVQDGRQLGKGMQ